jgi:hypothetical protein
MHGRFLVGKCERKCLLKEVSFDGRTILKLTWNNFMSLWSIFIWFMVGSISGCCEHRNEPSNFDFRLLPRCK